MSQLSQSSASAALPGVPTVLIVTGSLISAKDTSLVQAMRKQVASARASRGAWLDIRTKTLAAAQLVPVQRAAKAEMKRSARRAGSRQVSKVESTPYGPAVSRMFGGAATPASATANGTKTDGTTANGTNRDTQLLAPELTEVALMTLLAAEGVPYEAATFAQLHADRPLRDRLLEQCPVVFASTTLLRDLSELQPMLAMLKRPTNTVIAGGALASIIRDDADALDAGDNGPLRDLDILAVGYGELLVPSLAGWLRAGMPAAGPTPPLTGQLMHRGPGKRLMVLSSGVPLSKSLDDLATPDWTLAADYHGRPMPHIFYESVRGCPYRCAFCNYPYLFADTKFRMKSAQRIADDWATYAAQGAEVITCLDSLFTMPKRRLVALCDLLIARQTPIRWICYARADDLQDLETVQRMRQAGCIQVQIGIESGSQQQLDHMNKRTTVQANRRALENCRAAGITSLITCIVGFPGETEQTLDETAAFIEATGPDFYYLAPFNTRVEDIPILSPANRERFELVTVGGAHASAPYWRHATMCSTEVGDHLRRLNRRLMRGRASLEASLFYQGIDRYDPADRDALLTFQADTLDRYPVMRAALGVVDRWAQRRLERDVLRVLGPATANRLQGADPQQPMKSDLAA